jgi:hypothetical protein
MLIRLSIESIKNDSPTVGRPIRVPVQPFVASSKTAGAGSSGTNRHVTRSTSQGSTDCPDQRTAAGSAVAAMANHRPSGDRSAPEIRRSGGCPAKSLGGPPVLRSNANSCDSAGASPRRGSKTLRLSVDQNRSLLPPLNSGRMTFT